MSVIILIFMKICSVFPEMIQIVENAPSRYVGKSLKNVWIQTQMASNI